MTDTTDTTVSETTDATDVPEDAVTDEGVHDDGPPSDEATTEEPPETFPREVVEDLRKENGKYRQRAQQADALAQRLHTELVRATGRLADPTDLPFDEDHLGDADKMVAAIDELLDRKPHLATRRPVGDIGQGNRGGAPQPVSLLQILRDVT
ncbi:hypothetical protein [Mycolicibacterium elephantis]|uniref:hypothetical protein n=1 Tax=Mycolicibacterium elephantis TaxID=81858 RepID=UPI000A6CCBB5|nr:hypothetical protein [Mycolicibacterium elephantis]